MFLFLHCIPARRGHSIIIFFSIFSVCLLVAPAPAVASGVFAGLDHNTPITGGDMVQARAVQTTFKKIYRLYEDSVVFISTQKVVRRDPFWSHPFFRDMQPPTRRRSGLGTGFIISTDGYICTNYHVVANVDRVQVKVAGQEYEAKIIGSDKSTDIALLKISSNRRFKPVYIGDSDTVGVGDWSIAIGNPFGLDKTFTVGVISAARRDVGGGSSFLQTDASINPGNSGGPLINMSGEVIGVNRMIYSRSGGSLGIGFAIPINQAMKTLEQLKKGGQIQRGYIGLQIGALTAGAARMMGLKNNRGVIVSYVMAGSPADKAGIEPNDVILAVNGRMVSNYRSLLKIVANAQVGRKLTFKIWRDGKTRTVTVQIIRRPEGR